MQLVRKFFNRAKTSSPFSSNMNCLRSSRTVRIFSGSGSSPQWTNVRPHCFPVIRLDRRFARASMAVKAQTPMMEKLINGSKASSALRIRGRLLVCLYVINVIYVRLTTPCTADTFGRWWSSPLLCKACLSTQFLKIWIGAMGQQFENSMMVHACKPNSTVPPTQVDVVQLPSFDGIRETNFTIATTEEQGQ